jgi:nitrite reductase/ring-hydroxylating ferredoxin subunit
MTAENTVLCTLEDLSGLACKGLTLTTGNGEIPVFVVRRNGRWYGYINRCPHTGVNLDWVPDQFLGATGDLIQCATHGAQFRIEDGYCVYGPCQGKYLSPIAIYIHAGKLLLRQV